MRTIALLNQKGGVGKTTTAVNIGAGLSRLGLRVALADLDPQGCLGASLGVEAEPGRTTYEALKGEVGLIDILRGERGFKVAPSSLKLSGADSELAALPGKEKLLARAVAGLTGFDALLLDCPPNLGLITVNALAAAGEVLIPVQAEYLALASLANLLGTVESARVLNGRIKVLGVALTRYNNRKRLCREVAQTIRSHFPRLLFETRIRDCVALAEAPGFGQPIFDYAPSSQGALDYLNLCREILARKPS